MKFLSLLVLIATLPNVLPARHNQPQIEIFKSLVSPEHQIPR